MRLIDRLLALSDLWAVANDRSAATLSSRVARDGKLIDRLRDGRNCTVETSERFFDFFRDPVNWPQDDLPAEAASLLNDVSLGSVHVASDTIEAEASSPGIDADFTAERAA